MDGKLYQIFFDTSSVWMKTLNKGESKTNRKSSTHTPGSADVGTLKYDSQIISYDDMIENERFLKSKGFPVSLNESINYKILKTNPNKLKSNYEIYRKYGFFEVAKKTPLSMLGACRLLERCDLCVELGILNGVDANERECNLIKYSPTRLVNSPKGFFQYLAKLKLNSRPHEYYGIICSNKDSFAFNTITSQMQLQGLGTSCNDEKIEEFEHNNFVDVKEEIPNYYKYESLVSAINTDSYDKDVLSLPLIDKLETENKKNEFVYKFGEQIISRQKVLRISSVLNKCLKEFNEEMLFFAITKGSYINLDEEDVHELIIHEDRIINILNYLKSIGITNLKEIIRCRTELFYISSSIIKRAFASCNEKNIIKLINEDVSNFDLINI